MACPLLSWPYDTSSKKSSQGNARLLIVRVYKDACMFVWLGCSIMHWLRYIYVREALIGRVRNIHITCTLHMPSYLQRADVVTARAQLQRVTVGMLFVVSLFLFSKWSTSCVGKETNPMACLDEATLDGNASTPTLHVLIISQSTAESCTAGKLYIISLQVMWAVSSVKVSWAGNSEIACFEGAHLRWICLAVVIVSPTTDRASIFIQRVVLDRACMMNTARDRAALCSHVHKF